MFSPIWKCTCSKKEICIITLQGLGLKECWENKNINSYSSFNAPTVDFLMNRECVFYYNLCGHTIAVSLEMHDVC